MAAHHHTPSICDLKPGEPLMMGGYDWSWCFVWYKDIPGFPGYCAGSDGTVWSRRCGHGIFKIRDEWRKLKPCPNSKGYLILGLLRDGERHCKSLHRIIAETFLGPCPDGMECCHFPDPVRSNCRLSNLRWGTRSDNREDSRLQGNLPLGSRVHLAKLTEADIPVIRHMLLQGRLQKEIAADFGVHWDTISLIKRRKIWGHVVDV